MDSSPSDNTNATDQYHVFTGTWTNWSRGKVLGATLTLERRDADLVIAFTAFFIAFVATRTWRITCFAFHRALSTPAPQDVVYHQSQAILRNSSNPEEGILLFLSLLWKSRRLKWRWIRPLSIALAALSLLAAFTVAGGFSSRISTAIGDEVLIKSVNCGYFNGWAITYFDMPLFSAERIDNAAKYAQQCYSNDSLSLLNCERFVNERLTNHRLVDIKASCPFKSNMCKDNSNNMRLDTGYIDSHDNLGLNAPSDKRILWRHVLHCGPLVTRGFTSQSKTLKNTTLYHYGNLSITGAGLENYMYSAESLQSQYGSKGIVSTANYRLGLMRSLVTNGATDDDVSDFIPIDSISREDADIVIYFLSGNEVRFVQFAEDEWYNLNPTPYKIGVAAAGNDTSSDQVYLPLEAASPLGCTDQYQFCSTQYKGPSGCGPLASFRDAVTGAAPFFNTTYEEYASTSAKTEAYARFQYFADTVYLLDNRVTVVISLLGPRSLLSQSTLVGGFQGPIAPDQWKMDVMHWQDISLASIQQVFLTTPVGPTDPESLKAHKNYNTTELKKLCNSQKIRSTGYPSFSLFGLYIIYIPGLLLVLTSYLLEPVSRWLHKRKYRQHAHLEWTANTTLQLQRLAHEEIRVGTWTDCTDTIPATKAGELLGCLDINDLNHPILCPPKDDDGPYQDQVADETPEETVAGTTGEERVDTAPGSTISNVAVSSESELSLASFNLIDEYHPLPQGCDLNTDEVVAQSGDPPMTSSHHRLGRNGHASDENYL
ncbi:hypothetical protein F4808DRAFT_421519 [Astrocystis sublimbata]|nr:hypothetical protein F4808DRAFT_421519 [Astrocystis sublimbata]